MNQECVRNENTAQAVSVSQDQSAGGGQSPCTYTLRPAADVVEGHDSVTLFVDLPGVSQSDLEVAVENGVLEITATPQRHVPEGYRPVGSAAVQRRYRRQFKLADTLDTSGIEANLNNGLLSLVLPKKPENRRTKISIGTSA